MVSAPTVAETALSSYLCCLWPLLLVAVLYGVARLANITPKPVRRSRPATPTPIRPPAPAPAPAPPAASLPYQKARYLLTRAERSFYGALCVAAGSRCVVFPKLRLIDLLWLPGNTPQRQRHLNRVISKHVDFVLCRADTLSPVLVVELDDSSHQRANRQERDAFVNAALKAAGLPVLRMPVAPSYNTRELERVIEQVLRPPEPTLIVPDAS